MDSLYDFTVTTDAKLFNELVIILDVLIKLRGQGGIVGEDRTDIVLGRGSRQILADSWVHLLTLQVSRYLMGLDRIMVCYALFDLHF